MIPVSFFSLTTAFSSVTAIKLQIFDTGVKLFLHKMIPVSNYFLGLVYMDTSSTWQLPLVLWDLNQPAYRRVPCRKVHTRRRLDQLGGYRPG